MAKTACYSSSHYKRHARFYYIDGNVVFLVGPRRLYSSIGRIELKQRLFAKG